MSHLEEGLLRRFSGARIVAGSLLLGAVGVGPLLFYIAFGPVDGNPIGLGLLALVTVPVAGLGLAVGLIKMLTEAVLGSRR